MSLQTARFIANLCVRTDRPIPLDVFAALHEAGIDVTEYERTIRNG